MEIVRVHTGAYFPQVIVNGERKPITDILDPSSITFAGIVDQVQLDRRAVGIILISDNANSWFSATGSDLQKGGIYVPTLAELGYPQGYSLRAAIGVTCLDPTNNGPQIELRLLDYADFSEVSGFSTTQTLAANSQHQFVKSTYQPISGGKTYMIDFRADAGKTVRVRVNKIFLQIVKS